MRQRSAADLISCRCPRLKTLELDEKMRSREGGRTNLFQTDRRAKITPRRMPNCLVHENWLARDQEESGVPIAF